MSWMYYNKETEETCLRGYISELSCFHAVVMAEQTWKSSVRPDTKAGNSKTRQKQFFEDLTTLLNAQEEKRPVMEHQNDYICTLNFPQTKPMQLSACREKVTMSLFSGMRSFLLRKSASRINNQEVLHYELETL